MIRKMFFFVIVVCLLLGGAWAFFHFAPSLQPPVTVVVSPGVQDILRPEPEQKPEAQLKPEEKPDPEPDAEPEQEITEHLPSGSISIPPVFIINGVPFLSQAPSTNWELPFKEACEEASVIMVNRFYSKRPLGTVEEQDKVVSDVAAWGEEHMGAIDTDLETTARYFTEYLEYDPKRISIVRDFTIDDMKAVLASNRPIIIPAAGRDLGNKYFREPGPIYHMLVVIGYDHDEFITHDPGTRHGENYRYNQQVLFDAIHDLTPDIERIREGRKAMMIVSP